MKEVWRTLDSYEVSSLGRVRSKLRMKILNPCKTKKGYLAIYFGGKTCTIHRLIAKAFIPNPGNKPTVNHKNGIKTDNRVENLEWASYSENISHAFNTKLIKPAFGSNSGMAKLDELQVRVIKDLYFNKLANRRQLEKYFKVEYSTLSMLLKGRTWRHVKFG